MQRLGRVEQSSRHVQRVADIGNLAPEVADFAGDDLAAMKGGSEFGHDAELCPVLLAVGGDEIAGDKGASEALAIGRRGAGRPWLPPPSSLPPGVGGALRPD